MGAKLKETDSIFSGDIVFVCIFDFDRTVREIKIKQSPYDPEHTITMADPLILPESRSLANPPTDGITALEYIETNKLASTSWDGAVRIHDTANDTLIFSQSLDSGPLFSFASSTEMVIATGGMDGSIRKIDMGTNKSILVGKHKGEKASCSCLASLGVGSQQLASAGWHKQFHVWDIRQQSPAVSIDLPGKAFSMDVNIKNESQPLAVVATSGRRLCFMDIRKETLLLDRESSLQYQTRCVKFFPSGQAIALGSIEGRAAVEYLQDLGIESPSPSAKNFAFKCHRDGDMLYPVNAIDFHPGYGTFATGGCDGTVGTYHRRLLGVELCRCYRPLTYSPTLFLDSLMGWAEQEEAHSATEAPNFDCSASF